MEIHELSKHIKNLEKRLLTVADRLQLPRLKQRVAEIEAEQTEPTFWQNSERASELTQELSEKKGEVTQLESLQHALSEAQELLSLALSENDRTAVTELVSDTAELAATLERLEKELRFSGPHDAAPAIITIQAGTGGTDAQDWAQMLERMYLRYAEAQKFSAHSLDRSLGEEAGLKHTTFEIKGKNAYGLLKSEHGVHRLVRQSPFNADHLRQTSFARVEVIPKLPPKQVPTIDPKDLELDTFRASGAGGQHVNKTSSAVRIRHVPTGIVVTCQNERSQGQNKAQALSVLASKLVVLAEAQHLDTINELRGETKDASWGNQIRSYVLHPYQLVKDHRSNVEVHEASRVLDGDLSAFLDSYIEAQ